MVQSLDGAESPNAVHYELRRQVAQTRYAVVYEATDLRDGCHVALKLHRSESNSASVAFEREAHLMREGAHDHVVCVHETGLTSDGRPFLATEWVEGKTLEQAVVDTPPTVADVLTIAVVLVDVIITLHARGILHRDVKPLNVLIPSNGRPCYANAKLTDFGAACDLRSAGVNAGVQFGMIVGTPLYMAPEQLAGRAQNTAADVFGLGATLFYALFGRAPLEATDAKLFRVKSTTLPRIPFGPFVTRRLTEDVPVPSSSVCPPAMQAMLKSMLRCDPRERPHDLASVRRQLVAIQALLREASLPNTSSAV
jgi:serine/threonine protein kinase